jgi:hypothetical protein
MTTRAQTLMMNNYALLMEEVKQRIGWLNAILSGKIELPNAALQEFGFLQLRIICELIALACLTAHEDIPATRTKRLLEEWNATNILKRLEQLHPDFYPKPVSIRDIGPGRKHFDDITSGFLSKAELISLYARCSDLIHRGSVSKLLIPKSPWPLDKTEMTNWAQKIATLLRDHFIGHLGGETYLLCKMDNPINFNRVQVAFAGPVAQGETPPQPPPPPGSTILPGLHPSKPWKPGKR